MGTRGPGAFGNDDALNLPGTLTGQEAVARRPSLQQIFRTIREQPEDLNWTPGPAEIVAAAVVVVAAAAGFARLARPSYGRSPGTTMPWRRS